MIDSLFFSIYCVPSREFNPKEKNSVARLDFIRYSSFFLYGLLCLLLDTFLTSKIQVFYLFLFVLGLSSVFTFFRFSNEKISTICNRNEVQFKEGQIRGISFVVVSSLMCLGGLFVALT